MYTNILKLIFYFILKSICSLYIYLQFEIHKTKLQLQLLMVSINVIAPIKKKWVPSPSSPQTIPCFNINNEEF